MGQATYVFRTGADMEDARLPIQVIGADGAAKPIGGMVLFGSGIDVTLTPKIGQTYIFKCTDSTVDATVTLGGGFTFDGSNDIATFDASGDVLMVAFPSTTAIVISNPGALSFSGA